eukprot:scaffold2660_cov257-Pinguiococcus_pyrenoidosus.AAC.13
MGTSSTPRRSSLTLGLCPPLRLPCPFSLQFHPDWASTYGLAVDSLVRDIAAQLPESGNGPEDLSRSQPAADPLFPTARQKDWFDGHSWASGLFPQGNGKSQESSSEAVNAYYAVSLYGLATGNAELQKWGSFLLSSEIHAAQYYYHIGRDNTIYEPPFSASRMVGNLGAGDVTASTWFGDKPEYVHGIQVRRTSLEGAVVSLLLTRVLPTFCAGVAGSAFYGIPLPAIVCETGKTPAPHLDHLAHAAG